MHTDLFIMTTEWRCLSIRLVNKVASEVAKATDKITAVRWLQIILFSLVHCHLRQDIVYTVGRNVA